MHTRVAYLALHRHEAQQAVRSLRAALQANPAHAEALYNLGTLLCTLHAYDEASPPLRRAVGQRPSHVCLRLNLGVALAGLGDARGAEHEFRTALNLAQARPRGPLLRLPPDSSQFPRTTVLAPRRLIVMMIAPP